MNKSDAFWAYFALFWVLVLGIAIGTIYTRAYYDAHCPAPTIQLEA